MKVRTPILVINFKNFEEVFYNRALELALAAQKVGERLGVEIAVSPPTPTLGSLTGKLKIPVFSQHIDIEGVGSSTGAIVPELLESLGVAGSMINHSEKRVMIRDIEAAVKRLRKLEMISLVCARTTKEVATIAKLGPDLLAIEPPELIGSGRAVSKVRPGVVTNSVKAVKRANSNVRLICGAGVVSSEDVEIALKLGAEGVLIASGVVKAKDWRSKIEELASPFKGVTL